MLISVGLISVVYARPPTLLLTTVLLLSQTVSGASDPWRVTGSSLAFFCLGHRVWFICRSDLWVSELYYSASSVYRQSVPPQNHAK